MVGPKGRFRQPEAVVDEMAGLRGLGFRRIRIEDDLFTFQRARTLEICRAIDRRGLDVRWRAYARVDTVDPEMLGWMRRAGCERILFGAESGSREILKGIRKGIRPDQTRRAVDMARDAGIGVLASFILGLPGETPQTLRETLDFARSLRVPYSLNLLTPYPPRLRKAARKQLEEMGVEVMLGRRVIEAAEDHVTLDNGEVIPTYTLIWAAGVRPSPLAKLLGVALHRSGAVPVLPTLEVIGAADVYAVGDVAYLEDETGERYPMLIPPAQQQGKIAGKNIVHRVRGEPQEAFRFEGLNDRGIMATIGRRRAVAWIFYKVQLTGFVAWVAWLTLHLITLMGFRNRLNVFVNWVWEYLTYDRSVRIILESEARGALAPGHSLRRDGSSQPQAEPVLEEAAVSHQPSAVS